MVKQLLPKKILITLAAIIVVILLSGYFASSGKAVDFSADVKPIINSKCISCHGGVKAKAGFSLLFREEALARAESGKYAIVPGDPDASEMIRRINHKDPEERMPYKHHRLSEEEINILTKWVEQGAKWGDHWAYLPVKPVAVPGVDNEWIINTVDKFIYQELTELELEPSQEADKPTLLRRVSLDLIGKYPTEAVAKKFLNGSGPDAYEELVDALLASPAFGERWASMWLDIARYADSKGYEKDVSRDIWRYRDWVIKAFNEDKTYDRFLMEQIAGDLLPSATNEQYIATAFNRNSMTNDEGGTDNEEFRMSAVIDRVNTTWEGLMGTTFSCVQCHSHPYDPFRHEEYYSFLAYFNNTRDEDQSPEYPFLRMYNDTAEKQAEKLISWVRQSSSKQDAEAVKLFVNTLQPSVYASSADSITNGYIDGNNGPLAVQDRSSFRLKNINLKAINQVIFNAYAGKQGGNITAHLDSPAGKLIGKAKIPVTKGYNLVSLPIAGDDRVHDIYFVYSHTNSPSARNDHRIYFEWFAFSKDLPAKGTSEHASHKKIFWDLLNQKVESIPVMIENPPSMRRKTNVFERGNRLTLGKEVQPRVPRSLGFAMPDNAPADRRGLVMWLTDKQNPLVSRTMVNRIWEQLFGTGIVETLEDMGTQGSLPSHRELLDHYSWKFMNDYKWSTKKLIKEMVMSATYRQDSKMNEHIREKDPFNRYYARGPRVRLHAEQLRDQHLSISGVMSDKMYGPGVMPWQPEGIWSTPYNSESWKTSSGEDQYRRSVYTFIKRSNTYPSLLNFDATSRINCTPRRIRTNTPLQALVTLNDSAFVDMAAHFADRMKREAGDEPKKQLERGYEIMLYKKIPADKLNILMNLYERALREFNSDTSAAGAFTGSASGTDISQHAALKAVANAMLNLDEVITKN